MQASSSNAADSSGDVTSNSAAAAPDGATAAINRALLLCLRRQHASALALLRPLYEHSVEGLDEGQALRLCLLLVELHLASGQLAQAASVLHFLEHSSGLVAPQPGTVGSARASSEDGYGGGGFGEALDGQQAVAAGGMGNGMQSQEAAAAGARDAAQPQPLLAGVAAAAAAAASEGTPGMLFLPCVTRVASPLMAQVRQLVQQQAPKHQAGQKAAQDASSDSPPAMSSAALGASLPDVKLLLRLCKARLYLAAQNHRAAKKEVKLLLAAQPRSVQGLGLKAQLEASRQHPRKALRTLGPLLHSKQALDR